jgi:hypothetical protein
MTLRQIRIGSLPNIGQYDDGIYNKSMEVEDPIKCTATPVAPDDLIRLQDMGLLYPVAVTDIDNPTELTLAAGTNGMMVLAYKVVGPAGLNEYTIYAYDSDGPAVNVPYVVDAAGVGSERWIAIAGKYNNFAILPTLTTKNPPIDADLIIYRDSTTTFTLVTSTWTQIKAFLKTYFDGLYGTLAASHARAHTIRSATDHTDVSLAALANDDLMQWDDPSSKWEPKSIDEVLLNQAIAPGPVTIGTVEDWRYADVIADDGTKALPTIKANYAAKVEVIVSSAGIIDANATFMIDSTGTVTPQVDSGNCVYNVDTDIKLCIGTAAAQNPLTIKYRLGSAVAKIMIIMKYVKV